VHLAVQLHFWPLSPLIGADLLDLRLNASCVSSASSELRDPNAKGAAAAQLSLLAGESARVITIANITPEHADQKSIAPSPLSPSLSAEDLNFPPLIQSHLSFILIYDVHMSLIPTFC